MIPPSLSALTPRFFTGGAFTPMTHTYGLVGSGRLASHFSYYLNTLSIPHVQWSRRQTEPASQALSSCDTILILIPDDAIEPWIRENAWAQKKALVHCSGALVTPLAAGLHPLMCFSHELYEREKYTQIPFIFEAEGPSFSSVFPCLPNPSYPLAQNLKPLYHSLCVMGGNFSTLLWQKLFQEFENKLHLPWQAAKPYLQQTSENLLLSPQTALTGPLGRGDRQTLQKNLKALEGDPFQHVYKSFMAAVLPSHKDISS